MSRPKIEPDVSVSLESIGRLNGIDQSSVKHNYLGIYEQQLARQEVPLTDIVLISGSNAVKTANTFAAYFSDATIHVLSTKHIAGDELLMLLSNVDLTICRDIDSIHEALILRPRPQVIIDDGDNKKSQKINLFRELFFYLPEGGQYIVEDLHAAYIDQLVDVDGDDIATLIERLVRHKRSPRTVLAGTSADDLSLSRAIQSYTSFGKIAFVTKAGDHLYKLREHQTNAALEAASTDTWGSRIDAIPAREWESRARVSSNRQDLRQRFKQNLHVPDLQLREYLWATCQARQVCTLGSFLLPDSFRHSGARRLSNVALEDSSARFAQIKPKNERRSLKGTFFYLDTEYPGHFGHVMTEVVSRLWGWIEARRVFPDIRVLVSLAHDQKSIPTYQAEILATFGIEESMIEYISPDEEVVVERLVAATPQFSNPNWSDTALSTIWGNIRDSLATTSIELPERIFISRKQRAVRSCNNTAQLEALFEENGFTIVFPETLNFREQVAIFSTAKVVAGFGGSGLFGTMFAKEAGTRIVIAGETYIAMNEYLISAVLGDDLHYFWCKSDKKYPPGLWTAEAFRSNFTFDFEADGERLTTLLNDLG
ncbi:capsular polysaccharide biosynthesis protein [Arthrobacter pascens]|uniref:glycosyltransferase family 61 protein n=1 Tax=Arthrobacter pascens TaxID=1677 RepID=UPI0027832D62|nr:glycosyltransferase 61 family protein [Arthrobacter pascens]MDQ0633537.1 capsular polysaccharide biosynthesis protein [Arthrobacter pascens]